jgi:hypothetical protein
MATPARWRAASTTACRPRAPRQLGTRMDHGQGAARACVAAPGLPLLPGRRNWRAGRRGGRRLQLLFDGSAMLHAMTLANEWRVGVLVDEAHNLVERGRHVLGRAGPRQRLRAARRRAWRAGARALDKLRRGTPAQGAVGWRTRCWTKLPGRLAHRAQQASHAMEPPGGTGAARADAARCSRPISTSWRFCGLAESFGAHSGARRDACEAAASAARADGAVHPQPDPRAVPEAALRGRPRVRAVLGDAGPAALLPDMLGLPADTAWIDVESPFEADQLSVQVVRSISTRYPDRQRRCADRRPDRASSTRRSRATIWRSSAASTTCELAAPNSASSTRTCRCGAGASHGRSARDAFLALRARRRGDRLRGAGRQLRRRHRPARRPAGRRLHRHAGPAAGEPGERADQGLRMDRARSAPATTTPTCTPACRRWCRRPGA